MEKKVRLLNHKIKHIVKNFSSCPVVVVPKVQLQRCAALFDKIYSWSTRLKFTRVITNSKYYL